MRFLFKIASRFLSYNKWQTIMIITGIAVGISIQIFVGALISGLQISLVNRTVGRNTQVTITSNTDEKYFLGNSNQMNDLKTSFSEFKIITKVLDAKAMIEKNNQSEPMLIRGFNLDEADEIYQYKDAITEGRLPSALNEVMIGIGLKNALDLKLNDKLALNAPYLEGRMHDVTVVGFFDLKVLAINNAWAITSLKTTEEILDKKGVISSVETQLKDVFDANKVASKLREQLDDSYHISSWMEENEQLLSGLKGQSISSYFIQTFVVISVVLAISSILIITVMQKNKQIGILKAMGLKNKQTGMIFVIEGFILGGLGALFGAILGILLLVAFSTFALNPDGSPVVPVYIDMTFIMLSVFIATIVSMLSSLIPSRKSAKLDVVEVIRNA